MAKAIISKIDNLITPQKDNTDIGLRVLEKTTPKRNQLYQDHIN